MVSGNKLLDTNVPHTGTLKNPTIIRGFLEGRLEEQTDLVFVMRVDPS